MRVWWTIIHYEMLKYSRMPSVIIILFGLPLLLIFLLGSAFDQEIKPAKVALYIGDHGGQGKEIEAFWSSAAIQSHVKVNQVDSDRKVQDLVRSGSADYGVSVPSDYSAMIAAGNITKWNTYSGRYDEKNMAVAAVVNSYMVRLNQQLAAVSTLGPGYAASGDKVASPSAGEMIFLKTRTLRAGGNGDFGAASAMQYYAAAYLIMFLLYGGMSAALSLLNQKTGGTLLRVYAMPSSFRTVVSGVIAGSVILAAMQAAVIVLFTMYAYEVEWGSHFGLISLICLLTAMAGSGLAIIIASFARTAKLTQTVLSIVIFAMTFLSGGMAADIRGAVGDAAKWNINHWANVSLRAVMSGTDLTSVWSEIAVLSLITVILIALALIRLPKVVKADA